MYGHHLLYSRVIWISRVRLPSLLVVSSTGKLSVLADASVVSTYICTGTVLLFVYVYIPGNILKLRTYNMYIRARFTAVYAYMCNYSGMYVELCLYV